ncbi:MAG: hypothetical protein DRN27_06265 [Thermoplasmata archaeon]|nr:MAG: hypothetical protein DRN27_06265 [Thermoplasmata archaeon]
MKRNNKKIISILLLIFFINISLVSTVSSNNQQEVQTISFQENTNNSKVYRAVIIGIGASQGLPYSIRQIKGFKTNLLNNGNWEISNIKLISEDQATKNNIKNYITWLDDNADEDDVSLFYYVGHGGNRSTDHYINTYDELLYDYELTEYFENISGTLIVFIDACKSGGFIDNLKNSNRIILTACDADENTYQVSDLGSGIFGYFINLSLTYLTKNVEPAFLFTKIFVQLYGRKLSREYGDDYVVHPQLYDGTQGRTRLMYRNTFGPGIMDSFMRFNLISNNNILWRMDN